MKHKFSLASRKPNENVKHFVKQANDKIGKTIKNPPEQKKELKENETARAKKTSRSWIEFITEIFSKSNQTRNKEWKDQTNANKWQNKRRMREQKQNFSLIFLSFFLYFCW